MPTVNPYKSRPSEYSENDGTIEFYLRVRSLIDKNSYVLDLGAGRAAWYEDDTVKIRRDTRYIKPIVKHVLALDVDSAVLSNNASTENMVYDGSSIPLDDASVDIIISDFVLEHVAEPESFAAEAKRILRPGGYLCARTPHKYNYVSIGARLFANSSHFRILKHLQPDRKEVDVFPTVYKLNTIKAIQSYFPAWEDQSYIFRGDPAYYFNSLSVFNALKIVGRFLPSALVGNIFVFLRKPGSSEFHSPDFRS